jgi:hypothetical protein
MKMNSVKRKKWSFKVRKKRFNQQRKMPNLWGENVYFNVAVYQSSRNTKFNGSHYVCEMSLYGFGCFSGWCQSIFIEEPKANGCGRCDAIDSRKNPVIRRAQRHDSVSALKNI